MAGNWWVWSTIFGMISVLAWRRVIFGKSPSDTRMEERHAAGVPAFLDDYMTSGFYYGAMAVGVLGAILAMTAWYWSRPLPSAPSISKESFPRKRPTGPRWRFWAVLALLLLVFLPVPLARMNDSFWGDEALWYEELIGGRQWVYQDEGLIKHRESRVGPERRFPSADGNGSILFQRHDWKTTAFFDKYLHNQYLFTILARLCDDAWHAITGTAEWVFAEWVLRIPAFLAAVAAIIGGALFLRRIGHESAGLCFAALLVIHPWFLRYASEARGYTLLTFFLLFGAIAFWRAIHSGRWAWWALVALAQFGAVYTWKAAVHPLLAMNLCAVLAIVFQNGFGPRARLLAARQMVSGIVVLMVFLPLFFPGLLQISRQLEFSETMSGGIDPTWFLHVTSHLAAGMNWPNSTLGGPFPAMSSRPEWLLVSFALVAGGLIVLGFLRLARTALTPALLLVSPAIGAVLSLLHFSLNGTTLLYWYVFYILLFLILFASLGLVETAKFLAKSSRRGQAILSGIGVVAFAFFVFDQWRAMLNHPTEQSREAVALMRKEEGIWHQGRSEIVTIGLYFRSTLYDPRMGQHLYADRRGKKLKGERLRTPETLREVMAFCQERNQKLRVAVQNLPFAKAANHEFLAILNDSERFLKLQRFSAMEDYIAIDVYEMID